MIAPALLAATMTPLLPLPLTGVLAEAAYLKARFYADHYGKAGTAQIELVEKATTYAEEKATAYNAKKRPDNQRVSGKGVLEVYGVVGKDELAKLVKKAGWACWSSPTRLNGLLMMVADAAGRAKKGVFEFSCSRARLLSSSLSAKFAAAHNAPGEALAVLEAVGVFVKVRPGRDYPFARGAEYCFGSHHASRGKFNVQLKVTPKQAARWHSRQDRVCERFEWKNPIVGIVRETAARMEFSARGYEELLRLPTTAPDSAASAQRCFRWLQQPAGKMTLDRTKTLHSPISGCPKIIRPYLLIDGEDAVEMDISGAHIVLLTKIYEPDYLAQFRIPHTPEEAAQERMSLTAQIEAGDVYGGETPEEREDCKLRTLKGLNRRAVVQMATAAAEPLLAGRRILTEAMWKVKESDYRYLGFWLQRWLSDVVNPAVMSLHERGIPSIPIVDCLMVRWQDEAVAREELVSRMFASTGVRAKVRVKSGARHESTNATLIAA